MGQLNSLRRDGMITTTSFLKDVDWETDFRERVNPGLINRLIRKAVPALEACEWQITHAEPGVCESLLPLNPATTNQHGTHQAALISLSADYTGGMALVTLLRGVPMAGVHVCQPNESASLWLASMNVRYIQPSTGHLIGRCRIPEKEMQLIVERYAKGKRVLVTLPVEFESNGQRVAEAEMAYFVQPTIQLLDTSKQPSVLFQQKIKASARMIAGVRASRSQQRNGRLLRTDCPYSTIAAGPQGQMLAQKLKAALPQLTDMVHARTEHSDQMLRSIPGLRQVVLVGVGLDMRAFRLAAEFPDVVYFDVDLPAMLAERQRVIEQIPEAHQIHRTAIPADFIHEDLAQVLHDCPGLHPELPTAVIYEGCSMYFESPINQKILRAIGTLLQHPASRVWTDFATRDAVEGKTDYPEVAQFLKSMTDLGESFIFGANSPGEFLESCGLRSLETTTVRQFLNATAPLTNDPVLDTYLFNIAAGG